MGKSGINFNMETNVIGNCFPKVVNGNLLLNGRGWDFDSLDMCTVKDPTTFFLGVIS
jgi:hypothetical protein